jgi:hypothetical protein
MNYSEMTDFEINCEVARKLGFIEITGYQYGSRKKVCFADGDEPKDVSEGFSSQPCDFNPCNSWADAGPIIEKHLICLAADVFAEPQDGGKWVAQPAYGWDSERVRSDNPLRAAMITYLMMSEADIEKE